MIVSGLLSPGGAPGAILRHWQDGRIGEVITSATLVSEVAATLTTPYLAGRWSAVLVTGDRHLLDLPRMPAIMSPRTFLRLIDPAP